MTDIASPAPSAANTWIGPLMVLGGGIGIGFAPIGLRVGLDMGEAGLGPQAIAFWRYLMAAPLLLAIVLIFTKRAPARPNAFIILAGIFFTLDIALWHWALALTTVANATFIVNLGNVCVGFTAWLFLKERPANIWFIAVLIAIGGAALLSQGGASGLVGQALGLADNGAGTGRTPNLRGDLLALAAAVLVSGYMLCSKIARRTLGGLEAIFWLTCVEVCVAGMIVLASGERFWPDDLAAFKAPLFLAIVVQVIGQGLIITGLGRTPAAIAGILLMVQPVVAAAVSWQMFGEVLTGLQGIGGMLILFGVYLSQRGGPPAKPAIDAIAPSAAEL